MFVSCIFVNVCVKRNGNRKEGGREDRAERDTCSDTETERDEKERERKNLVSTRNTAPLPLSASFLPACGGWMGWRGAGGLTSVSPAPSTHRLRGFHGKAGVGQGPVESGAVGGMRAVFVGVRVCSVWAKPASLGWVSGAAPVGSISSFTLSLFPVVTSKMSGWVVFTWHRWGSHLQDRQAHTY